MRWAGQISYRMGTPQVVSVQKIAGDRVWCRILKVAYSAVVRPSAAEACAVTRLGSRHVPVRIVGSGFAWLVNPLSPVQ